jgi:4-carboxymuconolactone decarboxylase
MEANYPERHHELQILLGKMRQEISGPMSGFEHLHKEAIAGGALSAKHKDLTALAIAIALRCDDCIAYHVHDALHAGASRQEILETVSVAIMMGGGPAMMYACHVYDAIEQFEGRAGGLPSTSGFLGAGVEHGAI